MNNLNTNPNDMAICKGASIEAALEHEPFVIEDYEETVAGIKEGGFNGYVNHIKKFLYGEMPEDTKYPAAKFVTGRWMFGVFSNTTDNIKNFVEFGYADISLADNGEMDIILHPRLISYDEKEPETETDENTGYFPFKGNRTDDNGYKLTNDVLDIYMNEFYASERGELIKCEMVPEENKHVDLFFYREGWVKITFNF